MEEYTHEEYINAMKMQGREVRVTPETIDRENKKAEERSEILRQRGGTSGAAAGAKWEQQRQQEDVEREKRIRQEHKDKLRKIQSEVGDTGTVATTDEGRRKSSLSSSDLTFQDESRSELLAQSEVTDTQNLERRSSSTAHDAGDNKEEEATSDSLVEEVAVTPPVEKMEVDSDVKQNEKVEVSRHDCEKTVQETQQRQQETVQPPPIAVIVSPQVLQTEGEQQRAYEEYTEVDPTLLPPLLRDQFPQHQSQREGNINQEDAEGGGGGRGGETSSSSSPSSAPPKFTSSVVKARTDVPYSLTVPAAGGSGSSMVSSSPLSTTKSGIIVSLHWVGRNDLDLSAVILNPRGKLHANFFFGETPFADTMVHSGDMLHGPSPLGAVEQITIKDLNRLPVCAVSTIYFIMSNFSGESTAVSELKSVEAHVALTTTTTTTPGVAEQKKGVTENNVGGTQKKNLTTKRTHPLASFDAFRNAGSRATALCRIFRRSKPSEVTTNATEENEDFWSIEYLNDLSFTKGETVMELGKDIQQHLLDNPTR